MARRLRRSELSTPASNMKMIESAARSDADLVFLDMEDSVAPAEKEAAREKVVEAYTNIDWGGKVRAVRVNALSTPWGKEDVEHVLAGAGDSIDVLILPKAETADDVRELEELVGSLEDRHGIAEPLGFEILIEHVKALINAEEIAVASDRVEALIFGKGDFAASMGARLYSIGAHADLFGGDPWLYPRNKIIVAARAAGIDAIDAPVGNYRDLDAYSVEALRAALQGAVGKWAIHPAQVAPANAAFSPPAEEVERARKMIAAIEEAEAEGLGAVIVDGEMVDVASAVIMRNIVDFDDLIVARDGAS